MDEINWNTRHAAVNDADRTAAITGLTNGTTYYVSVAARNDQGYGNDSPSTSIKAGLPAKLRYAPELGSGDSKLDAKIFSSSADGNGSPITDYDLRYRTNGTTTWTEATDTTSTAWQQTITGLTNGTTYDVQARAQNTHGDGPWSFWATLTAGAPGAPVRPSISNGSWDFSITWNAPGDSGSAITDYDVQYLNAVWERKKGNGSILIPDDQDGIFGYDRLPWKDWESDTVSTTRSATVTDLVPGLYYWTRIRAKNARGVGAWSEVSIARLYYPTVPDTSSNCVRNGATTLQWAWSCEIKNGVGGVGEFDTATITAGDGIIKAGDRNKANDARFIAFNPNGGTATVKTYKDGAVVDTFTITVTAFAINTVTASDMTPSPGDTITVDVSLTSPFNLAFHENFLDDEFEPITDRFKRSWVQLELPTGWTGTDHSGASVNQPVQVVGYNKSSVSFTVTLPSNASTEETTIPVNAYSMGLPEGCSSNANCLDDLKIKEVRNLKVNESSGMMTMSVVAANPPAQVTPTLNATTDSITAKWNAPASPAAPITGYEAQYFHDETWTTWATPAADAVSATLSGLEAGQTYRVRIRARNAHGWGDYTNPYAEITLPHAQPPAAVGSVSAQRNGGNVAVAWNAAARATRLRRGLQHERQAKLDASRHRPVRRELHPGGSGRRQDLRVWRPRRQRRRRERLDQLQRRPRNFHADAATAAAGSETPAAGRRHRPFGKPRRGRNPDKLERRLRRHGLRRGLQRRRQGQLDSRRHQPNRHQLHPDGSVERQVLRIRRPRRQRSRHERLDEFRVRPRRRAASGRRRLRHPPPTTAAPSPSPGRRRTEPRPTTSSTAPTTSKAGPAPPPTTPPRPTPSLAPTPPKPTYSPSAPPTPPAPPAGPTPPQPPPNPLTSSPSTGED